MTPILRLEGGRVWMQSIVDVGNAAMSHTGTAKYRGQHDEERFRKPPKGNVTLRIFPAQTRLYEVGSYRVCVVATSLGNHPQKTVLHLRPRPNKRHPI